MQERVKNIFAIPDFWLFFSILFLSSMGLLMVYSSSSVISMDKFGDSLYFLKRQLLFVSVGFLMMFTICLTDYEKWIQAGKIFFLLSIISLLLLYIPGIGLTLNGAKRWISVAGMTLQPAEFAKVGAILYLTSALLRKGDKIHSIKYGLLPLLGVTGIMSAILYKQPDFGNAVIVAFLCFAMLFFAGARIAYLLGIALLSLPAVFFLMTEQSYRMRRLMAYLNPWDDPQNTSYQIVQSFTAFFSGGLFGRGLGNSHEKLYFLPEAHSDFIFAVIGEELGFLGVFSILCAYFIFLLRGYRIALSSQKQGAFLLVSGATTLVAIQALLNMAVVTGLLPTKGLPLPFISHGGSSIMTTFIACGFILSVARKENFGHVKSSHA